MATPEAERFRITAELAATGIALQRQNLRRRHPELPEADIDRMLDAWLVDRPLDVSS